MSAALAMLEPIRPPRYKPRKHRCACGRRAVFIPKRTGKFKYDRTHPLCPGCFLKRLDRLRAAELKRSDASS